MTKIAVLLATFNRKEKTLACIKALYNQTLQSGVSFSVYLTDDASSDGTQEAVAKLYPKVNILKGTGSLFWAGGMRNSWSTAKEFDPDYYLLLNDDTLLEKDALSRMLAYTQTDLGRPAILVGSTVDASGKVSYGGHKLYSPKKVQSFNLFSESDPLECDLANANIMLVPREIVKKIGILSDSYTHSIADFDYTMTAKRAGFRTVIIPGVAGYCADDHGNNWKSANVSLKDRIKYLKSPKGLAYDEYLHFIKIHFPKHLPAAFTKLWLKTLFPVLWDKFKVREA